MYPVSNAFLQKIKENTREYYWTGTIVTTYGTRYTFQNADILKGSAYINHKSCSADEMELGSVNAAEMKITLFNNIDRYTLMDAEVRLTYHLRIDENTVEDVPMGVFIVTEANRNIKTLELVGYDRMLLLDKEFSVTDMVGTPYQILHLMAEACGIVLEQSEQQIKALTNGTETFSIYTDNDIETWRDVLFYLAQAMCCFASFNREGKLELKQYGMNPVFEVNNTHRFTSSFSDFKTRYTAVSSTNLRTQMAEYYALETDDALTMNLGTNPMLQYGLEATRKRIIERILYKLAEFEYVPFDSTTIGNPALDVGDVIVNRGGHADEDSYYCITEYECRINGKQTLKGVGKNPRLASAKSKNDKNISGLINQAEENKIIYYKFVNAYDINVASTPTEVISIAYVAVEDTTAMFMAQVLIETTPDDEEEDVILKVTYKKGLEEETTFYPIETFKDGKHIMALLYPITVGQNTDNTFSVYMNIIGSGSALIKAGNIRATISGQGLAAGLNVWDGKITVEDEFSVFSWNVPGFTVERYVDYPSIVLKNPVRPSLTSEFGRVAFGQLVFKVNDLNENLNAEPMVRSFTVDYMSNRRLSRAISADYFRRK
ncbi:hypothetical protein, partial [Acetivibrio ethanolgignens]